MARKRLLLFLALIIVSLILLTHQTGKGIINPLKLITYSINKANEGIHSIKSSIKNSFNKIRLRDEENKRLQEEVDSLLLEQQGYKEMLVENTRLRELLSFKEKEKRYVTAARVIARGSDRWANTLVLDKGRLDGVKKDMAVITPRGLIGKILTASDSNSNVLLVTDRNFSAAVRLYESRTEGILSGTGSKSCVIKYVSDEHEVKENEPVHTSGLDSLFPSNVPVGYVSKAVKKGIGLFQEIEVTPFHDITKLEEVIIIKR